MPQFVEIAVSETASDFFDLQKVYRLRVYRRPVEVGTQVEVYFEGMAAPVTFSREQADQFLAAFNQHIKR